MLQLPGAGWVFGRRSWALGYLPKAQHLRPTTQAND